MAIPLSAKEDAVEAKTSLVLPIKPSGVGEITGKTKSSNKRRDREPDLLRLPWLDLGRV